MKKKTVKDYRFLGVRNDEDSINTQEVFEVKKGEVMKVLKEEYKDLIGKKIIAIEPVANIFPDGDCILITVG